MASKHHPVDLKGLLEAKIKQTIEANQLEHRGGFLTTDFVTEIFTTENLAEQLKDHPEAESVPSEDLRKTAQKIRDHQKQLYAILLLMGESRRIHSVIFSEVNSIKDEFLFRPTTTVPSLQWYTKERLDRLTFFDGIADTFYRKQWIFPPSLLTTETLEFPEKHFVFPFESAPELLGSGLHGDVYKVTVSSHFLQIRQSEQVSHNNQIAYKKILKRTDRAWALVQREVDMLQARRHNNITPLLGNFFAGLDLPSDAESSTRCLYLLSPLATMDMEEWLKRGIDHPIKEKQRHSIYFDAMLGLASGVTYIHREINERVGYHRDIKPSNLLLFREAGGSEVWKICDFGSSNLKSPENTGTKNEVTSKYWAPIEFFTDQNSDDGQTHGRSHDVFSLGCVFLYLATVSYWGKDRKGLQQFEELRVKEDSNAGIYKNIAPPGAFCKSMPAVHEWVEKLLKKSKSDEDKKVLGLIQEMLLPRIERVYAWEVEIDLFILADPKRSCEQTNKRLDDIIQPSRGYNSQVKHNPYLRAKRAMEEEVNSKESSVRSEGFLDIIYTAGWLDYSPQSTTGTFTRSSMSQTILSNIPSPSEVDAVFGRQELYKTISNAFLKSDIVALYGLGGVGKSRIAQEYASQFMNPTDEILKRHTFKVYANSKLTLLDSYNTIVQQIRSKGREKTTQDTLKAWLEDRRNGGWFMVVHGFDSIQNADELWDMLPVPERGLCQMIITSRTRAAVTEYLGHDACIPVDTLSRADSMRLFNHHVQRALTNRTPRVNADRADDGSDHETESLLEVLWSPFMIKSAAEHMNKNWFTVEFMKERLDGRGFSAVKTRPEDYLGYILRPLLLNRSSEHSSWPRVVHFLFLLAFFAPEGISWDLLLSEYKDQEDDLDGFLKTLQDCSMVSQDSQQKPSLYVLNGHVRRALLGWIEHGPDPGRKRSKGHGPEALLQRYNKTLSMTYRTYKNRNSLAKRTKTKPTKSDQSKQALMRHFECFLDFTKKYPETLTIPLGNLAVRSVILFSKILLDKDRYDDAMEVTAYAHAHFKCDLIETNAADDETSKEARVSFHLVRQLVKVYLALPEDDYSAQYWWRAQELIEKLHSMSIRLEKLELEWTRFTSPKLEIQLDKVRVCWKSKNIKDARRELCHIVESTGLLKMEKNRLLEPIQVVGSLVHLGTPKNVAEDYKRRDSLRELQLKVTRENGLLHTAEGMFHEQTDPKLAAKSWRQARQALTLAQRAAKEWFSEDIVLEAAIGVEIAVVNTKIGTPDLVNKAIKILNTAHTKASFTYGSCRRTWDMERRLNEARLRSKNKKHITIGTESSRGLLALYEKRLGMEKVATKKCAMQLEKGLRLTGQWEERDALVERYRFLEQDSCDDFRLFLLMKHLIDFLVWLVSGRKLE